MEPNNNLLNNTSGQPSQPVAPGFIPPANPVAPQPEPAPAVPVTPIVPVVPPAPVVSEAVAPVPSSHILGWVLALIVVAAAFGGGGYYVASLLNSSPAMMPPTQEAFPMNTQATPIGDTTSTSTATSTANWKTYANLTLEFRYPSNWVVLNDTADYVTVMDPATGKPDTDLPTNHFRIKFTEPTCVESDWSQGFGLIDYKTNCFSGIVVTMSAIKVEDRSVAEAILATLKFLK